jgi:hypothetical protein
LADRIQEAYGVKVDVIEGARGEFTVWLEGDLVAEKTSEDFPDEDVVLEKLRGLLAQAG